MSFSLTLLAKEYPSDSIFHLNSDWLNVDGQKVKLSSLEGTVSAIAVIYTSCQYSCPLILEEFNRIKAKISPENLKNVSFVLISMDPGRDTPDVLKMFASKRKLDLSIWRLLTASSDKPVRDLSAVLGVNYKKTGDDFAHSNSITVIGPQGVIEFAKPGIGQEIEETAAVINKSAAQLMKN